MLTTKEQSALKEAQYRYLEQLPVEAIAAEVAGNSNHERDEIAALLETFSNESRVTLELVTGQLNMDMRLLEVGAGLCLTSLFLKQQGFNIVALEPALGGFGLFEQLKGAILSHFSTIHLPVLDKPAQALNRQEDESFDLIFSNNVIEHIPHWPAAMDAMAGVLNPDGMMVHSCPNYSIPYEPHYGIPVFRRLPGLSRRLFLSSQSDPEIWESLNFITCSQIKSYCKRSNLRPCFRKGLLYDAIKRIDDDEAFRERHRGLVATTASLIIQSGLGGLIRRIPPALSTPMIVEIAHANGGDK